MPISLPFPIREFPDRGTKWLLESPENVCGLLQVVAPALPPHLDFSRSIQVPTTFVPDSLRKQEADVILKVPFVDASRPGREVLVYILIEHQSRSERTMVLRILSYIVQVWDRQKREWQDQGVSESEWRLPLVIPILFYTGSERWTAPLSLLELVDLPEALACFVPSFDILWLDLKATDRETLLAPGNPFGWLLQVMQKADAPLPELEKALVEAVRNLEALSEHNLAAWAKAIYYLYLLVYHRRPAQESGELVAKISREVRRTHREEAETVARTMAEVLYDEGVADGRQIGVLDDRREMLLKMLVEKFGELPAGVEEHVRAMDDPDALELLIIRLLHVQRLEETGLL